MTVMSETTIDLRDFPPELLQRLVSNLEPVQRFLQAANAALGESAVAPRGTAERLPPVIVPGGRAAGERPVGILSPNEQRLLRVFEQQPVGWTPDANEVFAELGVATRGARESLRKALRRLVTRGVLRQDARRYQLVRTPIDVTAVGAAA